MVKNGTKCKRLYHNGDTIKSDNDGLGDYVRI